MMNVKQNCYMQRRLLSLMKPVILIAAFAYVATSTVGKQAMAQTAPADGLNADISQFDAILVGMEHRPNVLNTFNSELSKVSGYLEMSDKQLVKEFKKWDEGSAKAKGESGAFSGVKTSASWQGAKGEEEKSTVLRSHLTTYLGQNSEATATELRSSEVVAAKAIDAWLTAISKYIEALKEVAVVGNSTGLSIVEYSSKPGEYVTIGLAFSQPAGYVAQNPAVVSVSIRGAADAGAIARDLVGVPLSRVPLAITLFSDGSAQPISIQVRLDRPWGALRQTFRMEPNPAKTGHDWKLELTRRMVDSGCAQASMTDSRKLRVVFPRCPNPKVRKYGLAVHDSKNRLVYRTDIGRDDWYRCIVAKTHGLPSGEPLKLYLYVHGPSGSSHWATCSGFLPIID